MNYQKLVNRLRTKAFDYDGPKSIQHMRILKEAKCRMLASITPSGYAKRQEQLLFRTR
jgi:hypothetical protein